MSHRGIDNVDPIKIAQPVVVSQQQYDLTLLATPMQSNGRTESTCNSEGSLPVCEVMPISSLRYDRANRYSKFGKVLPQETGALPLEPKQRFIDRCSIDDPNTSQSPV